MLRSVLAPNRSALTLEGTRAFLVGQERVVVIDPGVADEAHLEAIAGQVGAGRVTGVAVTHGHEDHAAGADELGVRFGAPVVMVGRGTLRDGDRLETDAGDLVVVATPGHTADHVAFHWEADRAVFCGDLMMGGQETALVAAPEGRLGPYLDSLERIRRLRPRVIHPAHGPSFREPEAAITSYRRHRQERLRQVLDAVRGGGADYGELMVAVYGRELDPALGAAATGAIKAYVEYLQGAGLLRRHGRGWEVVST